MLTSFCPNKKIKEFWTYSRFFQVLGFATPTFEDRCRIYGVEDAHSYQLSPSSFLTLNSHSKY